MVRDLVVITIVATCVLLFALRCIMSLIGIETWTATWKLVDAPTGLLISPLERVDALTQTPAGNLTVATILASAVFFVAALVVLATQANRRD
ncbi:MAG TPA: hypothetical protein VEX37_09090 [Thermomicrobiales bacterium]|nr:hypothetical protein [Thermomicrobiales bacterium]